MKPEIIMQTRRTLDPQQGCRLLFTGIKHSGKSSLAQRAAEQLRWEYADSDDLILRSAPSAPSIRSFYRTAGKNAFMEAEYRETERYLQTAGSACLSLGGGASDNLPLLELCRTCGVILFLDVPRDLLYERIVSGGIPPFLSAKQPEESFRTLFEQRRRVYLEYADIQFAVGSLSLEAASAMLAGELPEITARYYGR